MRPSPGSIDGASPGRSGASIGGVAQTEDAALGKEPMAMVSAAGLVYRPIGLVSSAVAGAATVATFDALWRFTTGQEHPPRALDTKYPLVEIVIVATVQGAIFALVKALVDRAGARAFERVTGAWPGS